VIVVAGMRTALVLALALGLVGCGGSSSGVPQGFPNDAKVQEHDLGGGWEILWATKGEKSYAVVERDGEEVPAGGLTVRILGPKPRETVASIPQVAAAIEAPDDIENYTLLVDGTPLDAKAGGVRANDISVYGAPVEALEPGSHVAVAAARAGEAAAAEAWVFTVR
jgi:hypothetical protein